MKARAPSVLVLIDLVQDFEVLWPVLVRLAVDERIRLSIVVSRWLARRAPSIPQRLRRHRLPFAFISRTTLLRGWGPRLSAVDAVLTAAESTAGPHRWAHALVLRAKAAGVRTFTIQHGIDNFESMTAPPPLGWRVASDVLFCWPPHASLPAALDEETYAKAVCVGRPTAALPIPPAEYDLGVFENLHARRYDDTDRALMLDRIRTLASARPQRRLCIQTHPAGAWLDNAAAEFAAFENVTFVSSAQVRASAGSGGASVARAARVITTPSTVALDAAAAGRPVALALEGGPVFASLPVLRSMQDWLDFADSPPTPPAEQADFLTRSLLPGDAAERIVHHLVAQAKSLRLG